MKFLNANNSEKEKQKFLYVCIIFWGIYAGTIAKTIFHDNMIYAVGEINQFNNSLFVNNLYNWGGGISPRWFQDSLVALLMRVNGGNWAGAIIFLIYLGVGVFSLASANIIIKLFKKNHLLYSSLFALAIITDRNSLAGFGLFAGESLSIGGAYAFALLAISCVLGDKKEYNKAWICLSVASLLHIHEGVYGFVIIFIILLTDTIWKKEKRIDIKDHLCLLFYIVATLSIILPNMLTDSGGISNREFVQIYAFVRTPHHLVPSSWGITAILRSTVIILFCGLFRIEALYAHQRERLKDFFIEAGAYILLWESSIIFVYVFTEVFPIALVSTMMVAKSFKYIIIISLIWFMQAVDLYIRKERFLIAFFMGCYIFLIHKLGIVGIILWSLSLIWGTFCEEKMYKNNINIKRCSFGFGILFWGLLVTGEFIVFNRKMKVILFLIASLLVILQLIVKYRKSIYRVFAMGIAFTLLTYPLLDNFVEKGGSKMYLKSAEDILESTAGNDIYQLALSFGNQTKPDEMYMADPMDENGAGWFQVISERNCYVLWKVIPSVKSGVKKWYERYALTNGIFDKNISEIRAIMEQAGTTYILVNQSNYAMFDSEEDFNIFTTCLGDTYRVYQYEE